MADADQSLRQLIEEGTLAARQPPLEHLHRRVGRRRARRRMAGAALAAVLVAAPATLYIASDARPVPSTSGIGTPTATATTTARSAPPSLTTAQQRALVNQQAGTLTIARTSVLAGGSVLVSGHGCVPGQAVDLGFGPNAGAGLVVTVHADPSGSFEGSVAIPPATDTGVQRLWARCATSTSTQPIAQYGAVYVSTS